MNAQRLENLFIAVAALIILVVQLSFVTCWSGILLFPESLNSAYDSLGAHLLQGAADVDPHSIGFEGFEFNGKVYTYFGPFPALLRIVPDLLVPRFFGEWARLSCLFAALLSVLSFSAGLQLVLRTKGCCLPGRCVFLFLAILAFGIGSPLLYLTSSARIYHEAVLWALSGSMGAIYFLLRIFLSRGTPRWNFFLFSLSSSVALLGKVTFGIPLCIIALCLLLGCIHSTRKCQSNWKLIEIANLFYPFLPLIASCLFQMWYNYARFGSVLKFIDYSVFYVHPEAFGGEFNLARIPSTIYNYFRLSTTFFSWQPPFIRMIVPHYFKPSIFMGHLEQVLSLPIGSPWLVFSGTAGLVQLSKCKGRVGAKIACLSFLLQCALILSFYFVTQRYAAEFLPLLTFGFFIWVLCEKPSSILGSRGLALFSLLALWSVVVTPLGTLHWIIFSNPDAQIDCKQDMLRTFYREQSPSLWNGRSIELLLEDAEKLKSAYELDSPSKVITSSTVMMKGRKYEGININSSLAFEWSVPRNAIYFQMITGITDNSFVCGIPILNAWIALTDENGRELLPITLLESEAAPISVRVPLNEVKRIRLIIESPSDPPGCGRVGVAFPAFLFP